MDGKPPDKFTSDSQLCFGLSGICSVDISTPLHKDHERYKLIDQMSLCPHAYFIGPVDLSPTAIMDAVCF